MIQIICKFVEKYAVVIQYNNINVLNILFSKYLQCSYQHFRQFVI